MFSLTLLLIGSSMSAATIRGTNTANVNIPDGSPGAWVFSQINISGAPAGATVTGIDVYFRCVHPYSGDLEVDLEVGTYPNSHRLWDNEGAGADNPSRTVSTSSFNGLPVNNGWYLYARDTSALDAGYIDEWTITIHYSTPPPPTLSGVMPGSYPALNGNQAMTLNGANFVNGATLTFITPGGSVIPSTAAKLTFVSSARIDYQFNNQSDVGSWQVRVNNPDGQSSAYRNFTVTNAAPTLTSVAPSSYPALNGNQAMTLNGANFVNGATLTFITPGGSVIPSTAAKLTFVSSARIDYQFNNQSDVGSWQVRVNNPDGQSSAYRNFTVTNAAPTISSVSPNPLTGANTASILTVNGAGFVSGASVRLRCPAFGVDSTRPATFINAGQLQVSATFGTDPSFWTAQVINPSTATSSEFNFSVQAPLPVITSLSPSSMAAGNAAFTLRVNGSTFHQASVVRWNGANRTTTPVVSAGGLTTALDAQIAASDIAASGTATVTVHSPGPGGGTSAGTTFTIGGGGGGAVLITEDLIPAGRNNRPGPMTANYITIHDTDNTSVGANAVMHANYVKNPSTGGDCSAGTGMPNNPTCPKSWHFTVDDHEAYQHLPTNEHGWHAGDGPDGIGNRQSIGVEICMNSDGNRAQAEENAAWLTAKLLIELGLTIDRVKQHNHFSPVGKNCPSVLRGRPGGWEGFLARVNHYLSQPPPARPILSGPKHTGSIFSLKVPTQSGPKYILEYKPTLNSSTWIPVQTNNGTGGTVTLSDPGATSLSRFYRVRVE